MNMRRSLTIRLSDESAQTLEALAQARGQSPEDVAQDLLKRAMAVARFRQLREQVRPYAESAGFYSDDDVFDAVS